MKWNNKIVLNKENRDLREFPERKGDEGTHSFVSAGSLNCFPAIMFWRHPGELDPGQILSFVFGVMVGIIPISWSHYFHVPNEEVQT